MHVPIEDIMSMARYAPSGDNLQPWRFEWDGVSLLTLWCDHPSDIPEEPYYFRSGTHMGLGGIVEHVVIASAHFGYHAAVNFNEKFHTKHDQRVATITITQHTAKEVPSGDIEKLFDAIPKRTTDRRPYATESIDQHAQQALHAAVSYHGAKLVLIQGAENILACTQVIALHDEVFWYHPVLRNNTTRNMISDRNLSHKKTGMPVSTLGIGFLKYVVRQSFWFAERFPFLLITNAMIAKYTEYWNMKHSGAIGFIIFPHDGHQKVYADTWLGVDRCIAGQAMARLWLMATACGLSLQPQYSFVAMADNEGNPGISKKFEKVNPRVMEFLRAQVSEIERGTLVFAFRIGYPIRKPLRIRTPRKTVSDILKFSSKDS